MRPRTSLVVALLLVALVAPLVAWWTSGSDVADRQGARLVAQARNDASREAWRLAQRVGMRLEELRASESRRPWYHYQALYNDPQAVAAGPALFPSPLAACPPDPLVAAHAATGVTDDWTNVPDSAGLDALRAAAVIADPCADARSAPALPNSSFSVFQNTLPASAPPPRAVDPNATVNVTTTAFRWATVRSGGRQSLVAVRCVALPGGERVQGFVVSRPMLQAWLSDLGPATLVVGAGGSAAIPLEGCPWSVRFADDASIAAAEARADELRSGFLRTYALSACLALFGALAAIALLVQADAVSRRRAAFAAAAAHELRTPLAALRLNAEMLSDDAGVPAESRDRAGRVVREAERLTRVVANILGATRLERGGLSVAPAPGDAAEAVRDVVSALTPALHAAGMSVSLHAEGPVPAVFDREALEQVVSALLDNAERHSRGGASRSVEVRVESAAGGVEIAVSDSGPGVPQGRRDAIFRAFARFGPASSGGLGLGLAIARALCRAQGGDLTVGDAPSGGARFVVRLPQA